MELVLEQQGSCRSEYGGGLEGLVWSSREAARKRAAVGAAERLQWRGSVLVCLGLGLELGTHTPYSIIHVRVRWAEV